MPVMSRPVVGDIFGDVRHMIIYYDWRRFTNVHGLSQRYINMRVRRLKPNPPPNIDVELKTLLCHITTLRRAPEDNGRSNVSDIVTKMTDAFDDTETYNAMIASMEAAEVKSVTPVTTTASTTTASTTTPVTASTPANNQLDPQWERRRIARARHRVAMSRANTTQSSNVVGGDHFANTPYHKLPAWMREPASIDHTPIKPVPVAPNTLDAEHDVSKLLECLYKAKRVYDTAKANSAGDPLTLALLSSRVDYIKERIIQEQAVKNPIENIENTEQTEQKTEQTEQTEQKTENFGVITEPKPKHLDFIVDNEQTKMWIYQDGTAATSATLTHRDIRQIPQNQLDDVWTEYNKCFFIQIYKFYADYWHKLGILSPSKLLFMFRDAGGECDQFEMMDDQSIVKFANIFNLCIRVNLINTDLGLIVNKYGPLGNGQTAMFVNLDQVNKHYPNGAESED